VKFTNAMFEMAILEVPGKEPLSPESWLMSGPMAAPERKKFSKMMFWTTPLLVVSVKPK
jgi:hypothetical protein